MSSLVDRLLPEPVVMRLTQASVTWKASSGRTSVFVMMTPSNFLPMTPGRLAMRNTEIPNLRWRIVARIAQTSSPAPTKGKTRTSNAIASPSFRYPSAMATGATAYDMRFQKSAKPQA